MQDWFLKQRSNNTKHCSLSLVLFQVGFKPAGGIRSAKDSLVWLSLIKEELGDEWMKPELFRIGASTLLADIERQVRSSSLLSLEHLTSIFKKEIKNHLFKEDLQMDNAQMERCSTSLIIREQRSKLQRGITSHWSESVQFSSVQSFSRVRLFETPWTAARQASLSIINTRSLLKLMSIK